MKHTVTVSGDTTTVCKFEFIIKKDFLKKLKNAYCHIIISVQYLRTNFALSIGLGVFNT